jgi:hypothetical protein
MSGRLAPSTATPTGTPWPSTNWLRLTPFFARSVGFFPVFFPPEGCLGQAPVHAQEGPVDPDETVIFEQTLLPELEEDAGFDPFLEAIVGGGTGAELGGIEGFPLNAGAQDEKDGIGTDAVGRAGASAAIGMGVHMLGNEQLHLFPEFVRDTPVLGNVGGVHDCSSCVRAKQLQEL